MASQLQIKLNRSLNGNPAGAVIWVDKGKDGQPKNRYWRDRLNDAEIDGCCEVVAPAPKRKAKDDG